jgi:hypothetical protein
VSFAVLITPAARGFRLLDDALEGDPTAIIILSLIAVGGGYYYYLQSITKTKDNSKKVR